MLSFCLVCTIINIMFHPSAIKLALCVATIMFLALLPTKIAGAESQVPSWSWSKENPTVFSSNPITDMTPSLCPTLYRLEKIDGEFELKKVCFSTDSTDSKVRFGTMSAQPWGGFINVIGFAYDSKMYTLNGPCYYQNTCIYLPSSDTLVTKQYQTYGYKWSLVIYKNFTKRISRIVNGLTTKYNFDSSNPDYVFKNNYGYGWPIGSIVASNNGKWVGIELMSRGIGLLNVETLEIKRISSVAYGYGSGYDPTVEIAVSDSGDQVAIMGINAGLTVYDITPVCGDMADDENMSNGTAIVSPCKKSPINVGSFINRFYAAFTPRFSDDGGELNFYATSYDNESREVTLRAAGNVGKKLDYLALGDSYTSGEGETDDKYYVPGTNDKFEKCHLSTRSYPYLLAVLNNIDTAMLKSVACSGATTEDIVGTDNLYKGQGNRLGEEYMKLSDVDRILAKTQAKYTYMPGRVHQEFFAKDNNSKVITIGIGGNDAGLMDKLKTCVSDSGTCNWAIDPKKKEQTAVEIVNIFEKLVNTYKKINDDSPMSKIYAIGYPKIIDEERGCGIGLDAVLNNTEKTFMNESIILLNRVVENAAKSAGIRYIDIASSLGNQVLCGSGSPSAMNDVRLGDDNKLNWFVTLGNEGFHPNSIGHSLVADSIHNSIDNLLNFSNCANNSNICPDESIKTAEPSTYWVPEKYHGYPTQQTANYVFNSDNGNNRDKKLDLDSYSLSPSSAAKVELTSNPVPLGDFVTNSDGSLRASVTFPADLTEGYHTVHLYGTSYSGEPIELYQVIEFVKPGIQSDKPTSKKPIDSVTTQDKNNQTIAGNFNQTDKSSKFSNDISKPEVKGASTEISADKQVKTSINRDQTDNSNHFPIYLFVLPVIFAALIVATVIKYKKRR